MTNVTLVEFVIRSSDLRKATKLRSLTRGEFKRRRLAIPTLAEDARAGLPATRQVNLAGGIPLAFQAAVGKWVRAGSSVQKVSPLNLKQYW